MEAIDQEKVKEYTTKYTKIGLSTEPIDREAAATTCEWLNKLLDRNMTPVFAKGPLEAWRIVCDVSTEGSEEKDLPFTSPYLSGNLWAGYFAFYDYLRDVIGVTGYPEEYNDFRETLKLHLIYPLDDTCVFCERPTSIHLVDGQLHCESGPSVEYADGTKLWNLNGVAVPEWLVMTPVGELDPAEFAKIDNVEVRREFVRKVGIERICTELDTTLLDKKGDYELHEVDLGGGVGKHPYLKMKNPTIGVWHMECVDRACRTVDAALEWRNQSSLDPEQLT